MSHVDHDIPGTFTDVISGRSTSGFVVIRRYDDKERNRRILKYGGGCFVASMLSALIPLFHFILVPGFLIASVVMVVVNSRVANIESSKGKCPNCGLDFVIAKGKPEFPMMDVCGKCHHNIRIDSRFDSVLE